MSDRHSSSHRSRSSKRSSVYSRRQAQREYIADLNARREESCSEHDRRKYHTSHSHNRSKSLEKAPAGHGLPANASGRQEQTNSPYVAGTVDPELAPLFGNRTQSECFDDRRQQILESIARQEREQRAKKISDTLAEIAREERREERERRRREQDSFKGRAHRTWDFISK